MDTPAPTKASIESEITELRQQFADFSRVMAPQLQALNDQVRVLMDEQRREIDRVRAAVTARRQQLADLCDAQGPPEPGTIEYVVRCERPTPCYTDQDQARFNAVYRLLTPAEIERQFGDVWNYSDGLTTAMRCIRESSRDEMGLTRAITMLLNCKRGPEDQRGRILWLKNYHRLDYHKDDAEGYIHDGYVPAPILPPINF